MECDAETKEKKSWGLLQAIRDSMVQFCCSTSLHGLQYVGETRRPLIERLLWLLMFLTSAGAGTFFILKVWKKWDSTPVFVSFAETTTPVWDIPFPAITICPEIKVKETKFNYTEMYYKRNKTDKESAMFEKAKLVCRSTLEFGFAMPSESPENLTALEGMDEFLEQVSPSVDETMFICKWRGEFRCDEKFKPIVTEDGLCYIFNSLNYKELFREGVVQRDKEHFQQPKTANWSFENGYDDTDSMSVYPQRSMRPGARGGLSLFLTFYIEDVDILCNLATHGVKVVVHNPTDFPNIHDDYFRVNMNNDVVVGIKPRVMTTSDTLRSYAPKRRQCYYPTERHLYYFNIYSENNCQLECFTNYTLDLCDCVAFFMPRTGNTSVCGGGMQWCTEIATDLFISDDKGLEMCDCRTGCTDVKYDIETSQADCNITKSLADILSAFKSYEIPADDYMMSKVSFYYKDGEFVTSHRSELYGPADFLASCGGLLGLYLGFSLLSVVEVIYFLTVRVVSNLRLHRKQSKCP